MPKDEVSTARSARLAYRAALARLLRGEPNHPSHIGRVVRITPASVAREARRSRNPLYTTHRVVLDEIATATVAPHPALDLAARVEELEAELQSMRAAARRHAEEKRALASENLTLLYRARAAEARCAAQARSGGPQQHP